MNTQAQKEIVIDGKVYATRMLPTMEGLKLTRDVVDIFGSTLFRLKALGGKDVMSPEMGEELQALMARLGDPVLDRLVPKIMNTVVERKGVDERELGPVFDIEFRGRLGTFAQILLFATRAQCESFWSAFAKFMVPGAGATPPTA